MTGRLIPNRLRERTDGGKNSTGSREDWGVRGAPDLAVAFQIQHFGAPGT
jgi:hypothetical protein